MRLFITLFLVTLLTGCATTDFQPYEGKNNLYEGEGGTKVIVNGVEFWANGSPPRKYSIVGMVVSEVGSGIGDESMIRSAVANKVKEKGGDAAVQVTNNTTFSGILRASSGFYMATNVKSMQFAVIKYAQ
ncbi:hypothetical protein [Methylotenera sp.]|uniref:hypothetical protein n=1 Tax=Methylotenera sp. TaxID=2051956 RepID=UPI00272FB11E|nr:hypothetical protein [Methylotenera sp.]MDP2072298.1 hypothetical protein [Methylotenera sp.]MDP3005097.1 hypothetical protein [Methylotenera sp.]